MGSLLSLGRPGPTEPSELGQDPSEPTAGSGSGDDDDADDGGSDDREGDPEKGDRLQALQAELARRGLGGGPQPAPSPDQLSIIAEEREDLESQRSLANSRCSAVHSAGKNCTEGWWRCGVWQGCLMGSGNGLGDVWLR